MHSALTVAGMLWAGSLLAAQDLNLTRAIDYNPHPRVFETVILPLEMEQQVAVAGNRTRAYSYNGQRVGPLIEAAVGDTLIVHVLNLLNEPTVLHWHGVEVPARMDGSHIAQPIIPPGGYFRYEFKLNTAATFWYHAHKNTDQQVEKGLLGPLVVRSRDEDQRLAIPRVNEHTVVLDDIELDENNQVAPFATDPTASFAPARRAEQLANSRPGNLLLVNGREVSTKRIPTLEVMAGAPYRLRLINASSGQIFRLSLGGRQQWFQIGSDQGLWNEAEPINAIHPVLYPVLGHHFLQVSNPDPAVGVTLTPGDRADVVIVPDGIPGEEFFIESHDFIKGIHTAFRDQNGGLIFGHSHDEGTRPPVDLIRVKIVGVSPGDHWNPPATLRRRPIKPVRVDLEQEPLSVFFGHGFPDSGTGNVAFFANVARPAELRTRVRAGQMAMPPMFGPKPMWTLTANEGYHVKVGDTRYWEVVNFTGGDHNFHSHGFRFQHIDTRYVDLDVPANNYTEPARRLSYEDTIRVPRRPSLVMGRSYTIMRLAVHFDDRDRPQWARRRPHQLVAGGLSPTRTESGGWLVHCHFLTHAAKGMMSFITVDKK